ncbi:MAG: glycosyltransferase [Candidatus Heimdallarchaeum endolithica]|uniref:Glycosyltransferase n=1 Tax=Candidatus Heimdallarchaeum endolithica TaxID=2876572 RepID=A0A9Y1BS95_9ARCH|nr:MAG: glycosyltransferase [Candidatus Heimdallarchaeum endolithica]
MKRVNNIEKKLYVVIIQNFPFHSTKALSTYLVNITLGINNARNTEVTVIACENNEKNKTNQNVITVAGNPYTTIGNLKFIWNANRKIKELSKNNEIDIIHTIYPMSSLAAVLFNKKIRKHSKIIYELRSPWIYIGETSGYVPKLFTKLYVKLISTIEKILIRRISAFIFITEELHNFYKKHLPKNYKYIVIPSGINLDFFNTSILPIDISSILNLDEDSITLGYIGSLEMQRNLEQLVYYFYKSLKKFPFLNLVFIGDGTGKHKLEELRDKYNLSNKLYILNPVDHEKIPSWIKSFDICVSHIPDLEIYKPSFPLKILEYASLLKPVLATDIKPHRFFKEKYPRCYLYENEETFLSKLEEILQSINEHADFNSNEFSWKTLGEKIVNFYNELIDN